MRRNIALVGIVVFATALPMGAFILYGVGGGLAALGIVGITLAILFGLET